jgi:hypothetical protein
MIGDRVRNQLHQVFAHPNAAQARRSSGEGYATQEAHREIDVFHSLQSNDHDRDGQVELHFPGHSLGIPSRRSAEFSGCPQWGQMARVDGLFLSSDTHGTPTFETLIETQFHPEGIVKREASFGGQEVVARKVSVHHTDPSQSYVEEFRIAR